MLTAAEIEQHIEDVGHETRGIEFKGAPKVDTDKKYYLAKIVRAALSMANLRDGGHVVLGIAESNGGLVIEGLSDDQVAQWTDFDTVSSAFSTYADPPMTFEISAVSLGGGAKVVVIQVDCFTDIPHLCAKGYNLGKDEVLRQGALYVRNRRMPETSEVASHVEMREVLSIATQNALRDFVATAQNAGLELHISERASAAHSVTEEFVKEAASLWSGDDEYARRGLAYWDVAIRPQPFRSNRFGHSMLVSILERSTVRMRGWPVPYIGEILNQQTFIASDIEARITPHEEKWRLSTSGQFLHRRVVMTEFTDHPEQIPIWEVLFYLTEVVELAARLAQSTTTPPQITVEATLCGVAGRSLVADHAGRDLHGDYKTHSESLTASVEVPVTELLADPRTLAVQMSKSIFQGFGFHPSDEFLSDYQKELTN
ncbi:ATP-binding protein [Rhodococcus opacus]|uniref:ATP-binding protein n=1 Tax=Rhodococcus opacus TaxID=37919 RepID=UPI0006BB52C9|nr:ATP-binding protein [Rhodococcus opacus]